MSSLLAVTAPRLSVGVLTADLTRLRDDLSILQGRDVWAHVDVMDGHFCPTLTAGPPLIAAVTACGIPVDAHLLVEEPRRLLDDVARAGARVVTVHAEATRHLHRTLTELTQLAGEYPGLVRGVGLNPGTPVAAIEPVLELVDLVLVLAVDPGWRGQQPAANTERRVAAVRELARQSGRDLIVEVDGGVTQNNVTEVLRWEPDVVVSGSAIYDGTDPPARLTAMLAAIGSVTASASSSASSLPRPT